MDDEDDIAHFQIWQDGMMVAGVGGPRARAKAEADHYALVYSQDGPVEIREVSPK